MSTDKHYYNRLHIFSPNECEIGTSVLVLTSLFPECEETECEIYRATLVNKNPLKVYLVDYAVVKEVDKIFPALQEYTTKSATWEHLGVDVELAGTWTKEIYDQFMAKLEEENSLPIKFTNKIGHQEYVVEVRNEFGSTFKIDDDAASFNDITANSTLLSSTKISSTEVGQGDAPRVDITENGRTEAISTSDHRYDFNSTYTIGVDHKVAVLKLTKRSLPNAKIPDEWKGI